VHNTLTGHTPLHHTSDEGLVQHADTSSTTCAAWLRGRAVCSLLHVQYMPSNAPGQSQALRAGRTMTMRSAMMFNMQVPSNSRGMQY